MNTKNIKRYWVRGIVRLVISLFLLTWASYEFFTADDPFKLWLTWHNGLMLAVKIILIPAVTISLFVGGIIWCYKGFNEPPKRKLNMKKGFDRLSIVLFAVIVIAMFVYMWVDSNLTSALIFVGIFTLFGITLHLVSDWVEKGFTQSDNEDHDNGK